MLECGESAADIGIVTPRYLFPDLSLNEAGGDHLARRDRHELRPRPARPTSSTTGSGARSTTGRPRRCWCGPSFWRDIGGYDERYAPMYYEDTDLCFRPVSTVCASCTSPVPRSSTSRARRRRARSVTGPKRHQEINRETFARKWARSSPSSRAAAPPTCGLPPTGPGARGCLIVDYRLPSWDRDAGSLRLWHMIDALSAAGCRITMLPDDGELMRSHTDPSSNARASRSGMETSTSTPSSRRSARSSRWSCLPPAYRGALAGPDPRARSRGEDRVRHDRSALAARAAPQGGDGASRMCGRAQSRPRCESSSSR